MAAISSAPPPFTSPGTGALDLEDSNISSPLSDVGTKDDNDEDIEHMQLDNDDEDSTRPSPGPKRSDSDSVLSDAHSDVNSDGNDTEAETERLYDTPRHQRQRDVVVDQFNEGQIFEHSPSKLRRSAILKDVDHDDGDDDDSVLGDNASTAFLHVNEEHTPKPTVTKDAMTDDDHKIDSHDRKRKRSPPVDTSPSDQPLRKRTDSLPEADKNTPQRIEDTHGDGVTPTHGSSGTQTPVEEPGISPRKKPIPRGDELHERATRATKKSTRGSRRKPVPDTDFDTDGGSHDGARATDGEHPGDEADADIDEEIDPSAAHDEEMERKHAAYKDWTHIEDMFGVFRDRLYKDRLQRLEDEEQSLLAPSPTHPEYLNMKQCLDDRLEQKLSEINKELEYRMKAHERRSVAQRAQVWGQYFQGVREKREKTLEVLNQEWYDIQTARRSAHSLQGCGLLFPKDSTQRVRNAIAYNTEVAALATIAKYEGFPAGPETKGASAAELEDDLAAIERTRRPRHRPVIHPREEYHTPPFDRLGPAGEQFLRETPWANPNHLAHRVQPNTALAAEGLIDGAVGPGAQPAPAPPPASAKPGTVTVRNKKHLSPIQPGQPSESPEVSRPVVNTGHHQAKKVGSLSNVNRGSKTAAA